MKITYDPEADAMYIYLDENAEVFETKEINEDTIIDYDKRGNIVGIEILSVKEKRPQLLDKLKVENLVVG